MKTKRDLGLRIWDRGSRLRLGNSHPSLLAPRSSRRGVLLLVVLSMLTLFLLIGTAFIISANHYRQTQKMLNQVTETSNSSIDQDDLLNEVIGQLIRDTNNQNSALRFHSLLGDMYGNDGILGVIVAPEWATALVGDGTNITEGQLLQFLVPASSATDQFGINLTTLSAVNYAYNGQVLTFLDGPARGESARIVWHGPVNNTSPFDARLRVVTPRLADGSVLSDPSVLNGSRIAINGRPFNGTGVGFNRLAGNGTARLNAEETINGMNRPLALLPNAAFTDVSSILDEYFLTQAQIGVVTPEARNRIAELLGINGLGGSDESYDAVDFQNMALGLLTANATDQLLPATIGTGVLQDTNGTLPIPSFHRPALINYWNSQVTNLESDANLLRKVLLRPSWLDHPDFTGSNPEFANAVANPEDALRRMIYGPWDVDNDNDGVRDSMWVDFGAPVRENSDGRLVKPLAAVLVLDMDGRLNLNAHGSTDIANADPNPIFQQSVAGAGVTTSDLPQGVGFGPAEVSLAPILPVDTGSSLSLQEQRWRTYRRMFGGVQRGERVIPNLRDAQEPFALDNPTPNVDFLRNATGKYGLRNGNTFFPGEDSFDISAQLKMQGVPLDRRGQVPSAGPDGIPGNNDDRNVLAGYATLPDLRGRYAIPGLNDLGQPVYEILTDTFPRTRQFDSPYELDLSLGAIRGENSNAADGAYSVAELERVLRPYDADAGTLPARIWDFFGRFRDNAGATVPDLDQLNLVRTTLTTDSYDLPVPNVVVPSWMLAGPNRNLDPAGTTSDDYEDVMGRPAVGATFADLLEYRLRVNRDPIWRRGDNVNNSNPTMLTPDNLDDDEIAGTLGSLTRGQQLQREIRVLLPVDLANGLRLDINRPLGNGRDDNDNGVVDEPGEDEGAFWASATNDPRLNAFTNNNTGRYRDAFDRNGSGFIDPFEAGYTEDLGATNPAMRRFQEQAPLTQSELVALHNYRRQALARDLYVMAMTLVDPLPSTATAEDRQERARLLAQWAINVVDFRDPDNIMTAFEYDVDPFDGWGSNADPVDGIPNPNYPENNQVQLVWGAERPELLITETLAWHDRRTEPNAVQPTLGEGENDDKEYDQAQSPRGYGFIELYNPWPANPATNNDTYGTLGVDENGDPILGVHLSRTHDDLPGNPDPTTGDPVWRIAVYKRGGPGSDPEEREDADRPQNRNFQDRADRGIYFVDPTNKITSDLTPINGGTDIGSPTGGSKFEAFYSSLAVPSVPPGGYMVIGSGENLANGQYQAVFGENVVSGEERGILLNTGNDTLDLASNSITVENDDAGTAVMDAGGFPMQANDMAIAIIDEPRRFSFSEPAKGYPELLNARDVPFDDERAFVANSVDPLADGETRLVLPSNPGGSRTVPGFSWVYLQRLANPLLAWDADSNPYRTIDAMGVNVTTFTGLDDKEERINADDTTETFGNFNAVAAFSSTQRGRSNNPLEPGTNESLETLQNAVATTPRAVNMPDIQANLWNQEAFGADGTSFAGFWRNQSNTDGSGGDGANFNFTGIPDCTLGFLNEPFRGAGTFTTTDDMTPAQPFPWMTWNNRPFANAGELLQVPAFRSSQLLKVFSMQQVPTLQNEVYEGDVNEIDYSNTLSIETDGPYGHLMNFLRVNTNGADGVPNTADDRGIAGLYRLMDYVHVSSRFVGTETWLNPRDFGENTPLASVDDPRYLLQPPFNRVSSYREPGRVNLNTVVSHEVWDGGILHRRLFDNSLPWDPNTNNYLDSALDLSDPAVVTALAGANPPITSSVVPGHVGPLFLDNAEQGLVSSRRGYGAANALPLLLDPNTPTFFANPFRSAEAGDLVPLNVMRRVGVDCTMQRSGDSMSGGSANTDLPQAMGEPLFAANSMVDFNNANRNPFFRYQPMSRLSSMTTTRSNVYAVWVTIGYFEVTEAPDRDTFANDNGFGTMANAASNALYDRVYPDGFQFGLEAGSDTGDVVRVREFVIVDRTVPVAFEPGENHNVDKAIRLRRRIE